MNWDLEVAGFWVRGGPSFFLDTVGKGHCVYLERHQNMVGRRPYPHA